MRTDLVGFYTTAVILISSLAAGDAEQVRTISTTGEATVNVTPDEAIVTLGIQTSERELDDAKSSNDKAAQQIVQAVKALGIEDKHLATGHLDVSLRHVSDYTTITAYVVRRSYMVTVKDMSKVEPLVDSVLKNGANQLDGVEFLSSELRKHRDRARSMAIKAAKEKALALAKDLECAVGSPRTISESGGHSYWGANRSHMYSNALYSQNASQSLPSTGESVGTLQPGQIAIRATVSVSFDLVPPQ